MRTYRVEEITEIVGGILTKISDAEIKKLLVLDSFPKFHPVYRSHLSARFWIWLSNLASSLLARPSFL